MLNKIMLIGHLGGDVTARYTQSGTAVSNFSIATTERFKDKSGQQQEVTTWHRIVTWGRLAEICSEYLTKGSKVYIEGKLTEKKWTDQNGNERVSAEIVAHEMKMLDGKGGSREQHSPEPPPMGGTGEDLPF